MITGNDVQEILYHFMAASFVEFVDQIDTIPFDQVKAFETLEWLMNLKSISASELSMLEPPAKKALYEMLFQFVVFLGFNPDLEFPHEVLDDSSYTQLGAPLLLYMLRNPYPLKQPV